MRICSDARFDSVIVPEAARRGAGVGCGKRKIFETEFHGGMNVKTQAGRVQKMAKHEENCIKKEAKEQRAGR